MGVDSCCAAYSAVCRAAPTSTACHPPFVLKQHTLWYGCSVHMRLCGCQAVLPTLLASIALICVAQQAQHNRQGC